MIRMAIVQDKLFILSSIFKLNLLHFRIHLKPITMKKYSLLLFISFFTISSFAQESVSKFQFGFNISADYAYRNLRKTGADSYGLNLNSLISSRNNREIGMLGYNLGIRVTYDLTNKIELESGIDFSRRGFSTKWDEIITFNGQEYTHTGDFKFTYNYYCISVPVLANITLGQKKVKFIGGIGGSLDYLVQANGVSRVAMDGDTDRNFTEVTSEYNSFNLTSIISSGVSMKPSEKFELRLQPTFRFSLLDIIDAPISANLWSVGLNCGVYYQL